MPAARLSTVEQIPEQLVQMILIGTSGFQYPEWKGRFYPARMPAPKMLSFYANHFPTTEINYTFRQLPGDRTIASWLAQTPEFFRFTLKAPERITHHQGLRGCEILMRSFADTAFKLGSKRGTMFFQLPPHFKCDLSVLKNFVALIPEPLVAVFEFRHVSWFTGSVFDVLRQHNATLCIADTETLTTPIVFTGATGYFRLRRADYSPADLHRWAEVIREHTSSLTDIYVYLKHERTGTGPRIAKELMVMLGLKQIEGKAPEQELPLGG